jgi:hypothetical protein
MKQLLDPVDVEKRIRLWADVTMLSLELKRAMLRKKHPGLNEDELRELMHKELSKLKINPNE